MRRTPTFKTFNKSSYGLGELTAESIDAIVTDPPYGISYQDHYWDRDLPDPAIRRDCLRVMKPGAYGLVFSSVRLMHRLMVHLEDAGFRIRDVIFRASLNGMPKSRNVGPDIDAELGVPSTVVGAYKYVQGYKKGGAATYTAPAGKVLAAPASPLGQRYDGFGTGLKPLYEPVILIQKALAPGKTIAQNIIAYGTGALNLEATRIPFQL